MSRSGIVYIHNVKAALLKELDDGTYYFRYEQAYLNSSNPIAASLTLPLRQEAYTSKTIFPFFDGLIPEGWLLNLAAKNWKLDPRDRMGLLLEACHDCVGAVHIVRKNKNDHD